MKRFTEEHEWVEWDLKARTATVGITTHAAKELGDITFVELPELETRFAQGDPFAVVESVKAAADIFAPCGGVVAEVNRDLDEKPEIINASPEHDGWICKLKEITLSDLEGLMTEDEYEEFLHQKS